MKKGFIGFVASMFVFVAAGCIYYFGISMPRLIGNVIERKTSEIIKEAEKAEFLKVTINPIEISGEITEEKALRIINAIKFLESDSGVNEIEILLCSPGGSALSTYAICRVMQKCQKPIKIRSALAHSSAAEILSSGTKRKRYIYENSEVMIHPTCYRQKNDSDRKTWTWSTASLSLKVQQKLSTEMLSRNIGQSIRILRRDKSANNGMGTFFLAQEAVEYGFADSVISMNSMSSDEIEALISTIEKSIMD